MEWDYKGSPATKIPDGKIGFVYVTHYSDSSFYIGKKSCYSLSKIPAIKSTHIDDIVWRIIVRDKHNNICRTPSDKRAARALGCIGRKEPYRIINKESKWKSYEGSSSVGAAYTLVAKEIVAWCNTKQAMTYMETDLQFRTGALFDEKCLNLNILGKFFPGVLNGEELDESNIPKTIQK